MPRWIPLAILAAALGGCTPSLPLATSEPAAAVVDGVAIPTSAYKARLSVTTHRDATAGLQIGPTATPLHLDDFTIEQLVRERVVAAEAGHRGLRVSDASLQARISSLRQRAGATQFSAALQRNGFTPGSFADYERALLEEVALLQAMARDRIENVARELRAGRAFSLAAAQWSDDLGTSSRGGDAGWVRPVDLPEPTLALALAKLATGATSAVIATDRGFVIASVLERRADQVHLAEILVLAPSADGLTKDNTPTWFSRFIDERVAALRKAGKIQLKVGSSAGR